MATVPYVTSALGVRKFQDDGFLLTGVYVTPRTMRKFSNASYTNPLSIFERTPALKMEAAGSNEELV